MLLEVSEQKEHLSGNIDQNKYNTLQNLVIRSLYGNISASRNSA